MGRIGDERVLRAEQRISPDAIVLNVSARRRTSGGPSAGARAARSPLPTALAACSRRSRGRVTQRASTAATVAATASTTAAITARTVQ